MCPSSYKQTPCNRTPFLSEDGCDRGSVDIHMFDELPYCGPIDPILPEIPPELEDTPIIPLPSPPCSCFNIDYKMKLKYDKERKFGASASFRAIGDCCEGKYKTDFSFGIPCPVIGNGEKKFSMKIGYGDSPASFSGTYISADSNTCSIAPKNVNVDLKIPCPVNGNGGKLSLGIKYGKGPGSGSATLLKANRDICTIEPASAAIDLNIPCPIVGRSRSYEIRVTKGWKRNSSHSSVVIATADTGNCTLKLKNANLNLSLPCPVDSGGGNMKIGLRYGSGPTSASATFVSADTRNCMINAKDVSMTLNMPCPVRKKGKKKIKARIKYDSGSSSISVSYASVGSDCSISFKEEVTLNLGIPCPVREIGNRKIKARLTYGGQSSMSATYASVDSGCKISFKKEVMLDIGIPCPTKKEFLSINPKLESHSGIWSFGESSSYNSNTCKRTINLNLRVPTARFLGGMIAGFAGGGAFRLEGDRITNCNFYAAHQAWSLTDVTIGAGGADGTWYLNVDHNNLQAATVSRQAGANDDDHTAIPLFTVSGGSITRDYRGMPFVPIYA